MDKILRRIQLSRKSFYAYIIGIIVVALMPLFIKAEFPRYIMCMILVWTIIGMGWNFIAGYAGQASTGHGFFYGLGAYSVAILYDKLHLTPWVGMWVGVLISLIISIGIGVPLLRLKGSYFTVATMAAAECARIIFNNWKAVGGATGIDFLNKKDNFWYSMQFPDKLYYFYIFLAFAIVVLIIVLCLDKSKFGYYLRAIKGNPTAAESIGIDTSKYKLYAYMLSAAIVSIGGSLYATYMLYIDPSMLFLLKISLMICLTTVMGGVGKVLGPFIGAICMQLISGYTRVFAGGTGTGIDQIIYGVIMVVIVLYMPYGLLSLPEKIRNRKKVKVKES